MPAARLCLHAADGATQRIFELNSEDPLGQRGMRRMERRELRAELSYAVLLSGGDPHAVYLPEARLEAPFEHLPGSPRRPGRWLTTWIEVRGEIWAYQGPGLFVRRADLVGEWSAVAAAAAGLRVGVQATDRSLGRDQIWEWVVDGQRYVGVQRGEEWSLFGAGNTDDLRVETVLRDEAPANASALLWALGAVRLTGPTS
jgi:hypothetical protein